MIAERVKEIDFSNLLKAFENLKKSSTVTKGVADDGADALDLAKNIDYKVHNYCRLLDTLFYKKPLNKNL